MRLPLPGRSPRRPLPNARPVRVSRQQKARRNGRRGSRAFRLAEPICEGFPLSPEALFKEQKTQLYPDGQRPFFLVLVRIVSDQLVRIFNCPEPFALKIIG